MDWTPGSLDRKMENESILREEKQAQQDRDEDGDEEQTSSPIVCEGCTHSTECDLRGENEPHILEAQFLACAEAGKPAYESDDDWIIHFCCEDNGKVTLTDAT